MIEYVSAICAVGLVLFAAGHLVMAVGFLFWLRGRQRTQGGLEASRLPPAAILIAARGVDPTFARMLRAVSAQDYPDFEVMIVADGLPGWDSQWLPGWKVEDGQSDLLTLVSGRSGGPTITIVRDFEILSTCGMKCSALIAGWKAISERVEVCAFLDTDVIPGRRWLATLASEAMKPDCGSASGVQWFEPPDCRAGTLVRSLWNSAAVFPIAIFGNPWAGSMAMRREVIERSGLVERWAHSIVDDGPVRIAVNSIGLSTRFVSSLVMVNHESCSLGFAVNWIGRMAKWSRIFDPDFRNTIVHAFVSSVLFVLLGVTAIWGAVAGSDAWWWPLIGLVVATNLYIAGWFVMRLASLGRKSVGQNVESDKTIPLVLLASMVLVVVTQLVFCFQAFRALYARRYVWRGVVYDVAPDGNVSFDAASEKPGHRDHAKI